MLAKSFVLAWKVRWPLFTTVMSFAGTRKGFQGHSLFARGSNLGLSGLPCLWKAKHGAAMQCANHVAAKKNRADWGLPKEKAACEANLEL
uniref:Secreted protein n=1 Tax=Trichuris muris TaxID=70415 RepID=A0A5S6QE88_TRIMR